MIKSILNEDIYRIDHTVRFNGMRTIQQKESVSQHSYWVMFYSNLLFRGLYYKSVLLCQDQIEQQNKLKHYYQQHSFVLWQANWHDFDENITGDVLYHTKYDPVYGDDIKKALNNIKHKRLELDWERNIIYHDYDSALRTDYFSDLVYDLNVQEKSVCLNIVKMADWLSSLRFSYVEVVMGNKLFENSLSTSIDGVLSCLTQIELLDMEFEFTDKDFITKMKSQLIELKSKLKIL